MQHDHEHAEHGPGFDTYLKVALALAVATVVSFGAYEILGQGQTSMWVILAVSTVKATLVGLIFMHLKFDWGRLYGIIIPVVVMAIMMIIVLLPDLVLGWHAAYPELK